MEQEAPHVTKLPQEEPQRGVGDGFRLVPPSRHPLMFRGTLRMWPRPRLTVSPAVGRVTRGP